MNTPLTIEIHGAGAHNRGAELMAIAIAAQMRAAFPNVRIAVPASRSWPFEARARYGFLATPDFPGNLRSRALLRLLPAETLTRLGIVHPSRVDCVLDASGFAYSDQWGRGPARRMVHKMNHRSRRHQTLILLPQAFGPFKNPVVANYARRLVARADIVCARDDQSFAELQKIARPPKICQYPDFTLAIKPLAPENLSLPCPFAAIVPNKRMLDKTSGAQTYLQFLHSVITSLSSSGLNPAFVLHDAGEDQEVPEKLALGLPVLTHPDPRVLKWILGRASIVVGSRFHALAGALSQGVPCIGAGWSHKYRELFKDFACEDLLITDLADPSPMQRALAALRTASQRETTAARILQASRDLQQKTDQMWARIEHRIRTPLPVRTTSTSSPSE